MSNEPRFHVEVRHGAESVAAWLHDLPVHAEGGTIDAALDGLALALMDYADLWEKELRHAPNHSGNVGYVRRVQLAASAEAVRAMLESDAAGSRFHE